MLFKVLKKFWHFEKLVVRSTEVLGVKMQVRITGLWTTHVFLLNFVMVSGFPLGDTCKVSGSIGNLLEHLRAPRYSCHVYKQLPLKCLLYPLILKKTQHYFRWMTTMNQQWHWFIILFWRDERGKLNRRKRRVEKKYKRRIWRDDMVSPPIPW